MQFATWSCGSNRTWFARNLLHMLRWLAQCSLSYLHTSQCGRMTGDVWTVLAVWLSSPKASEKSWAMVVSFGPSVLATTDSGFGCGGAACSLELRVSVQWGCASTWACWSPSSSLTSCIDIDFPCVAGMVVSLEMDEGRTMRWNWLSQKSCAHLY